MKKIECSRENIKEFNTLLKDHCPEAHNLAKQLIASGLMQGLRGVTLELAPFDQIASQDTKQAHDGKKCAQCGYFLKDTGGDGTGAGKCSQNAWKTVLWAPTEACKDFAHDRA